MIENEISEEKIHTVATEINFLRLPIFKTTKSTVEEHTVTIDNIIDNDTFHIEITHGGNLTAFDRKILLILEYFYLQQNPTFQTNKIVTNFTEIMNILHIHKKNTRQIWESLSRLQDVKIKTKIKMKEQQKGTVSIDSKFNLLYSVSRILAEEKEEKRSYTNKIAIELNSWHVSNFRNKYYRIVNLGLIVRLRSGIAVRLFDYLNYKAFYHDKNSSKYKQKMKVKVAYEDLVKYLHIAERPGLKEIKKQFKTALNELKVKGILRNFEYEKNHAGVSIIFHLARSINWKETDPEKLKSLLTPSPNERELEKYGLSNSQIAKVVFNHSKEHISAKIDQLKYLMKFSSDKVKGRGSYLYQSIIDDWKDDSYEAHSRERKIVQKDITKRSMERLEQHYDEYVADACQEYYDRLPAGEKKLIKEQIEKSLEGFKEKIEGTRVFMYEAKRGEILRQAVDLMSFQEFCERRQVEKEQLALFEFDE